MQYQIESLGIGGIIISAVYNLILFSQLKKKYYLYLGILCFAISLKATLIHDDLGIFYMLFPKSYLLLGTKLEYFFSYATIPLALLFIHNFYNFKNLQKYLNVFLITMGIFLLIVMLTPYNVYSYTRNAYAIVCIVACVFIFIIIGKAINLKLVGAIHIFLGSVLYFLFVLAELLKVSGFFFVNNSFNFINLGFLLFLLFQSLVSSRAYAKSIQKIHEKDKNIEKRIDEKSPQFLQSNSYNETLIQIISHDLRGPLGNLKSISALFRNEQIDIDKAKKLMSNINSEVDRSIQMLDELTEWGHHMSQSSTDMKVKIKMEDVLLPIVNQMNYEIERKELSVSVAGDIEGVCHFNKNAIKVVIRNLLSNAVKFTKKGGSINIEVLEKKESIELYFKDTGIGIPVSIKNTLFQLKKGNNRPGTDNEKSSGIGLFICKNLIQQNEGSIHVMDNPEQKGSVFKLELKKGF